MTPRACCLLIVVAVGPGPVPVEAGVAGRAAREAAEQAARLLGQEASRAGTEALTRRMEALAARHGEEVVRAVRKAGPGTVRLIEEAGAHSDEVARLLAHHGETATWVAASSRRLALVRAHGDEAARALIRHRQVAEPALAAFGRPAARALAAVGPRNARRLAMMVEGGELARIGRAGELLEVVGRYGDRAMEFIWRHKTALAISAVLAAFLSNPEPFLNGARDLASVTAQAAARPVLAIPGHLAAEIVRRTDGTTLAAILLVIAIGGFAMVVWHRHQRGRSIWPGGHPEEPHDAQPAPASRPHPGSMSRPYARTVNDPAGGGRWCPAAEEPEARV
jgi:hypothetical protein